MEMHKCKICGNKFESDAPLCTVNFQKDKEEIVFCSTECLNDWVTKKIFSLVAVLVLGLILTIGLLADMGISSIMILFVPYMIRQKGHNLKELFTRGAFGECLSIAIVLLGAMTMIYPIYAIVQETREYIYLKNLQK